MSVHQAGRERRQATGGGGGEVRIYECTPGREREKVS